MNLLADGSFRPAGEIDAVVPDEFGVYAIRLRSGAALPEPFQSLLDDRDTGLIYIGQAEKQTLLKRLLGNELRARGNGPFIRSIGAVLGYRPPFGSLAGRARVQNYRFAPADRIAIVEWINAHLEVSWATLPQAEVHAVEVALVREHTPLLNLQDNPRALPELKALRFECRTIAAGLSVSKQLARVLNLPTCAQRSTILFSRGPMWFLRSGLDARSSSVIGVMCCALVFRRACLSGVELCSGSRGWVNHRWFGGSRCRQSGRVTGLPRRFDSLWVPIR